jgi:predicted Zn-dependent protease
MKKIALAVALVLTASPALAQFGGIGGIAKRAQQAKKIADLDISEKDERAIGEAVSAKLIDKFGVYQDPAVNKYVTLVGNVLTQEGTRPKLEWRFIILDTDGVNAFAAPGGLVHITRGALGLIKSEAELAGVLAHEIVHITEKHTINAIKNSQMRSIAVDEAGAQGGLGAALLGQLGNFTFEFLLDNKFSRGDENESDEDGVTLANKVGYSPKGLAEFLMHIAERNKDRQEPNGLFASHPQTKDRLAKLDKTIRDNKLTATATVQTRYASIVTFDATPVAEIATGAAGAMGAVGGGSASASKEEPKKEDEKEKKDPPKRRGFGVGALAGNLTSGKQAESTQASASAGGRMVTPDRDSPGGENKTPVRVTLTPAEVAEFKKGIVA